MLLKDAMDAATTKLIKEHNFADKLGINAGYCDQWVEAVLELLDKDIRAIGWWIDNDTRLTSEEAFDISHCVLWCDGKFYDCLYETGENDPLFLAALPKHLVKIEDLNNYKKYKRKLSVVAKRGNPPNFSECENGVIIPWGEII